jgi:hypothetical protein
MPTDGGFHFYFNQKEEPQFDHSQNKIQDATNTLPHSPPITSINHEHDELGHYNTPPCVSLGFR